MRQATARRPICDDVLVVVTGRIDGSTVSALREILHAAVDRAEGRVVIDVSGVDTIDATGLGMLVGTHRRADALGHVVVLRDVPVRMAKLLRVTKVDRVLRSEVRLPVGAA
ncbi:MAG: STAS domain-containing protein [Mycobacteriales bacterium]